MDSIVLTWVEGSHGNCFDHGATLSLLDTFAAWFVKSLGYLLTAFFLQLNPQLQALP